MQSIPGEKLHWSVRLGRGKISFVVLPGGREWLLVGRGKVWALAAWAAQPSSWQLSQCWWQLLSCEIQQLQQYFESENWQSHFIACESDSESSLISVFSSLEIHGHPGQPHLTSAWQLRTGRSSSKSLSPSSQRRLRMSLVPRNQSWDVLEAGWGGTASLLPLSHSP